MRVINNCRTALEQQTREAVRMRRRGGEGAILHSKGEYRRSYIPRLQLHDGDKVRELEQEEIEREQEVSKDFDSIQNEWRQKTKEHSLRK